MNRLLDRGPSEDVDVFNSSPPLGGEVRRGGIESSCNPLSQPLPLAGERRMIDVFAALQVRAPMSNQH
jgi:hypothetical protein